jgi:solute carrier family 25 thiamine pyrophosphate transporter 19
MIAEGSGEGNKSSSSRNSNKNNNNSSWWKQVLAGGAAGTTARLVIAPMDVVKIRLQLQQHHHHHSASSTKIKYQGTWQTLKRIVGEEGLLALWKGNLSAQLLYVAYGGVQFGTYSALNHLRRHVQLLNGDNGDNDSGGRKHRTTLAALVDGAVAGMVATGATYPLDLLRTRFAWQGNRTRLYRSLTQSLQHIHSHEGLRGFYRGLGASLLQIGPYMGFVFAGYEYSLNALHKIESINISNTLKVAGVEEMIAGAMAGMFAKLSVYPLDTVRRSFIAPMKTMREKVLTGAAYEELRKTIKEQLTRQLSWSRSVCCKYIHMDQA